MWPSLPHLVGSLLATASGVSEVPLSRVWPSLPHLVSNPLGVCCQLHRGFQRSPSVECGLPYHISSLTLWEFPRSPSVGCGLGVCFPAPSVGCGLPYHISSLTLWSGVSLLLATASGVSEGVPTARSSAPCGLPYHISSLTLWRVCWQLHRGFSECPLGRVWCFPTTSGLYYLEVCWQLLRGFSEVGGFPRESAPSVGCGCGLLPYHISGVSTTSGLYYLEVCWQLLRGFSEVPLGRVWSSLPHLVSNPLESAGNCLLATLVSRGWQLFRVPPRSGVAFPTTAGLYYLEVCWQLLRGFSEVPLGRVWSSLPHLVSTIWKSAGNCFGGFPRSPSVGCGLPYHIWSLTLWESAGNCSGTQTQLS